MHDENNEILNTVSADTHEASQEKIYSINFKGCMWDASFAFHK